MARGAIKGFPRSDIQIDDGILAHNSSNRNGGAIAVSNQMIYNLINSPGRESAGVAKHTPERLRKISQQKSAIRVKRV